jgi:hypothetical protein
MKKLLLLSALLVLAVPVAYAAPPAGQDASAQCREQRRTMGMADFRSLYAPTSSPKVAFDVCVARLTAQSSTAAKNAAKACQAERAADPVEFMNDYGKNGNKANAFGKCVSMKARDVTEEAQEATLDAAAACKADRRQMGAQAFRDEYGTNAKKSNAFGMCVKKKKQQQSAE